MFLKSLAAAALLALAACQPAARDKVEPLVGDAFLGAATGAKVTIIEYGAPTCPGCKAWHDANWASLKSNYIDNNKIKFIFREFPSHNPPVDKAIFAVARCAGMADWFNVIDEAFARQVDIEMASRQGKAMDAMRSLGEKFRLSGDQVKSCVDDKAIIRRVVDSSAEGQSRGVHSTPTFFLNDKMLDFPSFADLSRLIEEAIVSGGPAPATAPVPSSGEAPATPPAAPAATPAPGPAVATPPPASTTPPADATPPAKPPTH